jgi:hypothetical protein
VSNPGFESGLAGWRKGNDGTTLERTCATAHGGSCSATLGRGASNGEAALDDWPDAVASTPRAAYTATAWVYAPAGRTVKLRLRELRGSTVVRTKVVTVTGTGTWRLVSVTRPAVAGGTSLGVEVGVMLLRGTKAYVDDVSLTQS